MKRVNIVFFILFILITQSCDRNIENEIMLSDNEFHTVNIFVNYVLKEKEYPDAFSNVYVYLKKNNHDFINYDYIHEGVFSNDGDSILPDKSLIVPNSGMIAFNLDNSEVNNEFMIMVKSKETNMYSLTYFDKYRKGTSLKASFKN